MIHARVTSCWPAVWVRTNRSRSVRSGSLSTISGGRRDTAAHNLAYKMLHPNWTALIPGSISPICTSVLAVPLVDKRLDLRRECTRDLPGIQVASAVSNTE